MKRPGLLLIISMVVLSGLVAGICFGTDTYSGSQVFNNALQTSGVDVKIEATGGGLITPGKITDYNPRVTNLNSDSFVRVRFDVDPVEVFGLEKGWIKKGNCYYYETPLTTGQSVNVFSRIRIPENVSDKLSAYKIRATVDAIQAKNFRPDFGSVNPWGTIKVEQTESIVRSQRALVATQMESPDFNYVRPGTFECSTEDLFSNFENFQPGDSYSEMLNMRNNSGKKMIVHFRTDNQKTKLLEEMQLLISCCGNKVYEGSLSSEELNSFIEIAGIESGQEGRLEFQISMPESADNRYAMLKDNVTWIIAVNEETAEAEEPFKVIEPVDTEKTAAVEKTPGTGDDVKLLHLMVFMAAAALIGMVCIIAVSQRRKKK